MLYINFIFFTMLNSGNFGKLFKFFNPTSFIVKWINFSYFSKSSLCDFVKWPSSTLKRPSNINSSIYFYFIFLFFFVILKFKLLLLDCVHLIFLVILLQRTLFKLYIYLFLRYLYLYMIVKKKIFIKTYYMIFFGFFFFVF